ncbi:hypothetical protein JCM19301_3788 [Jejuia pallidilutea]|uniref:Uncharacterized protein n=1 Tax=Jejuia pallidilutea TaxID=504487 RepID=A0A090VMR8_9FLAO|nr:hypothetical protein JCM19301_3788 [Jejuia pallidilutea]GAL69391.1 hypothetical protein JCM19302_4120 [Jejuia pallidilutea]GAL89093.1 hypothetical protein JCM19538_2082 [Jejuia pallidilutea]
MFLFCLITNTYRKTIKIKRSKRVLNLSLVFVFFIVLQLK